MKIAICDDDSNDLAAINFVLENYQKEHRLRFEIKFFSNAIELLEDMRSESFDILFLDILMPGLNGMQAAHEIYSFDEKVKIIFLTSSPDFAVESYIVDAYTYLLKPVSKERVFSILNQIIQEEIRSKECIVIKCKTGIMRLLFSKLTYVEVIDKRLFFHMNDKKVYETGASLSEYEKVLSMRPEFIKVHRAFVVNLWQMSELNSQDFIALSGDKIPVSRRHYSQVREAFMKNLFSKI